MCSSHASPENQSTSSENLSALLVLVEHDMTVCVDATPILPKTLQMLLKTGAADHTHISRAVIQCACPPTLRVISFLIYQGTSVMGNTS